MHGLRWWEVDLGGVVIRAMKRLGLAWNVVLITPERQQQRMEQPRSALRPTSRQLGASRSSASSSSSPGGSGCSRAPGAP